VFVVGGRKSSSRIRTEHFGERLGRGKSNGREFKTNKLKEKRQTKEGTDKGETLCERKEKGGKPEG